MPLDPFGPVSDGAHKFDGYFVESSTGHKMYEVLISPEGVGSHRCNCPAWAIKRNRNGGKGAPSHCKHVAAVVTELAAVAVQIETGANELLKSIEAL